MNHNEIKERLLQAENAGQAAAIARACGMELTDEEAEKLFREIQLRKEALAESHKLDVDELEAVAGGQGMSFCKATVEADEIQYKNGEISKVLTTSWCWGGADYCTYWTETYSDTGIEVGHLYPD